jgi:enoyl reductase-like protein
MVVGGSGFGGVQDTFPYLTGDWAYRYNRPPMPFDGILLGSRLMTAKEAHTSPAVKQAIECVLYTAKATAPYKNNVLAAADSVVGLQDRLVEVPNR